MTIYEATASEIIHCPETDRVLGVTCIPKGERTPTKVSKSKIKIKNFYPYLLIAYSF